MSVPLLTYLISSETLYCYTIIIFVITIFIEMPNGTGSFWCLTGVKLTSDHLRQWSSDH